MHLQTSLSIASLLLTTAVSGKSSSHPHPQPPPTPSKSESHPTPTNSHAPAYPGGHAYPDSALFAKRSVQAGNCANNVGAMKQKRHQLRKRGETTDFTIHAEAPTYDFIKNETCILYPEVTQGPYCFYLP
jgi:hypothetical protein